MQISLNSFIDHTLLKPDATCNDIKQLCKEAINYQFSSVCINPTWVKDTKRLLEGSSVKLCTVVGFPLGANTTETKAEEARQLAGMGADELDMVINIGALKSKDYSYVKKDIEAVVKSAPKAIIKVIIETCLLTDEEKRITSRLCVESGAHFVKTSTGFSKGGATIEDVKLLRSIVGPEFGVKASAGIRDKAAALAMIKAGATRLGTSASVYIVEN